MSSFPCFGEDLTHSHTYSRKWQEQEVHTFQQSELQYRIQGFFPNQLQETSLEDHGSSMGADEAINGEKEGVKATQFGKLFMHVTWFYKSDLVTKGDCSKSKPTTVERDVYLEDKGGCCDEEKVSSLYSSWTALLNESQGPLLSSRSSVPKAPHLESCKMKAQINERLDMHVDNETFPPWTLWRGSLDMYPTAMEDEQLKNLRLQDISEGAYPPWDRMI